MGVRQLVERARQRADLPRLFQDGPVDADSRPNITPVAGVDPLILAAISLGAVFMGAMTYIGNGPNFMVRAIAESSGVKMPSFFGYMVYSFADPAADPRGYDVDLPAVPVLTFFAKPPCRTRPASILWVG